MKKYIPLFFITLMLFGCALKAPEPFPLNPEQAETIYKLNIRNKNLVNAKGFAKVELRETKKKPMSARCAFAYALPDKIRITLINNVNMPIVNIISDGYYLLYHDLQTDRKYKKKIKGNNIVAELPVSISRLISLMSGHAGIKSENIKKYISNNQQDIIILKDNTGITVDKKDISIIKIKENEKDVEIKDYKKIGDYLLPYKIVSTEPKKNASITIERYETNANINNAIFNTGD